MPKTLKLVGSAFAESKAKDIQKSALDLLNSMTVKKDATGKTKVPVITDTEMIAIVDKAIELLRESKNIETQVEVYQSQLRQRAYREYARLKASQGSFRIQGTDASILVAHTNRFSQIPLEQKETLQGALGKKYSEYFSEVYEVVVKDSSIEKIKELIELVGAEKFKECFEVKKSYIKVADDMNVKQFSLPADIKAIVSQYKASVKL